MNDQQFNAALDEVRATMSRREFGHAITALDELCRVRPDAPAEALLAECRYRYHAETDSVNPPAASDFQPEVPDDVFGGVAGVPEISVDGLDLTTLTAGIRQHGALLVRGLLPQASATSLAEGIEQAINDRDTCKANGMESPWYTRMPLSKVKGKISGETRGWVEMAGGVWAADSPRNLRALLDFYGRAGLIDLIAGYLGERPVLSVGKTTLRCVPADIKLTEWHQDGAFLGTDIRSVNVWVSLSHCGCDASGLDILPQRIERILPTGSGGAIFDWSVGQGVVEQAAHDTGTATPLFAPGDAMIFDHYFVHRTGIPAGITRDRYAIESWFFPPSAYPANEVPLYV